MHAYAVAHTLFDFPSSLFFPQTCFGRGLHENVATESREYPFIAIKLSVTYSDAYFGAVREGFQIQELKRPVLEARFFT
jgi:hypothetical protein